MPQNTPRATGGISGYSIACEVAWQSPKFRLRRSFVGENMESSILAVPHSRDIMPVASGHKRGQQWHYGMYMVFLKIRESWTTTVARRLPEYDGIK